ncbi:MAG: hypothetical protein H6819_05945 [Phycisphaerales bacterium]|nr:hypothetical protein [Phycisphaerales bacterium]MCB9858637.1 hypothetical protein [Phycisphaerales bacterium]
MTRKRTNDRPLLAARLRPFRRPPRPTGVAPALRLNHGVSTPLPTAHPVLASLSVAERTAEALHLSLEVFARIIGEVSEIDMLAKRRIATYASQSDVNAIAADCERAIAAIESASTCTDALGIPLFDGAWHSDLLDGMGRFSSRVTLPRVAVDSLGSDGVGGRLSSVGPDGASCLLLENPAIASAIVRSSALWLAAERERVFRILAEVIEPLVAELEVIEANTASTQMAGDAALAADLAHVTKLHALANAKPLGPSARPIVDGDDAQHPFRIRHQDDD